MAEDQGVNGDFWNDEASNLMKQFGWKQVGDGNIDVVNESGDKHGLDRMFRYVDARRGALEQGVFLEAKRYKTTSYSKTALEEWIKTLSKKLIKVRNSETFYDTFPDFNNSVLRTGIIMIWFSNLKEYQTFRPKFQEDLKTIKAPSGTRHDTISRIYVLENYDILRLASVHTTIQSFNTQYNTTVSFYYPTIQKFGNVASRNNTLTLDYIFSKFFLAEAVIGNVENKIVFYFGELNSASFQRLKSALGKFNYVDKEKPLTIYTYGRDDEFRKIKPDIERMFSDIDTFKLLPMDIYSDIPSFMKNEYQ